MTDAGWHPDPTGRPGQRYYDGSRWTEHIADTTGTQSVDPDGAPGASGSSGGGPPGDTGGSGIVIGPPPARSSAGHDHAPTSDPPAVGAPANQPAWGGPPDPGSGAGSWTPSGPSAPGGSWSGAPPAPKRKKVDKVSIGGLVLAVLGIGAGLASLFALPWLDVASSEIDFSDARQAVDDSGVFGAVASGLMINIAYFIVAVGGVVAVAKALGSRAVGLVGLGLAVIGLIALIVVGVAAIPVEGGPGLVEADTTTMLESEAEDRLAGTAVFTGVVMAISTVLAGVGLLLHGIGGRILAFLGLGLTVLFALGGILVLRDNVSDVGFGIDVGFGLGSWAIVASAALLAISCAVPGGRREV